VNSKGQWRLYYVQSAVIFISTVLSRLRNIYVNMPLFLGPDLGKCLIISGIFSQILLMFLLQLMSLELEGAMDGSVTRL